MWPEMNWRKEKKVDRHVVDEVQQAYYCGQENAECKRPRPNPYPKGRRHDAWEYGMQTADPMGDHHGRNK